MAYDESLAQRIRVSLKSLDIAFVEKKMFGGLAFMVRGRMCCGIVKTDLMVRVTTEHYEESLKAPHARPMDFTGRPMKGFLFVSPGGVKDARLLKKWLALGVEFVQS